ncbi:MAG: hypothetical protein A2W91_00820 [Bacteroidetes bacterium GWF2_38_335]|nr:MAG: hypothetical protein A2W91_00820 [Bacteroidetes bacterium GWF2_38_335]OFY80298.1 MAG: hypothetical protein A2281_17330 [Bacteroidetes bacterium RIFOXYA12_FULL_38_20]HBS88903.1 hypothetical protein [Bacteroidales bacterium]
MSCYYSLSNINANRFHNNWADICGGGFYGYGGIFKITNNLVTNNGRHAIKNTLSDFYMRNNTVALNQGAAIYVEEGALFNLANNIFWGNEYAGIDTSVYTTVTLLTNNIIESFPGAADPLFINPTVGFGIDYDGLSADWTLNEFSPAFNAGTPDTTGLFIPITDLDGHQRIIADTIDMGCFEYDYGISVDQPESKENLIVYPNPARDVIYFNTREIIESVTATDISGKKFHLRSNRNSADIRFLPAGIYELKIRNQKKKFTEKIMLIKL